MGRVAAVEPQLSGSKRAALQQLLGRLAAKAREPQPTHYQLHKVRAGEVCVMEGWGRGQLGALSSVAGSRR
jgi:hypothetical protein